MATSNTENAAALAIVVTANWLLAHLENDWTMPPEVQSSIQSLLVAVMGYWFGRQQKEGAPSQAQAPKGGEDKTARGPATSG